MRLAERGSTIRLRHVYVDLDGHANAPTSPKVNIYDSSSQRKVQWGIPELNGTGESYYDLSIPEDALEGYWMIEWYDNNILQPTIQDNPSREVFKVLQTRAGLHPARNTPVRGRVIG